MLVLSRNENDSIEIGREIVVTILSVKGGKVRVGIEAPQDVNIVRTEIKGRGKSGEDEKRSA
jgi:carbon storage regulator